MANGLARTMWNQLFRLSASCGLGLQEQIRQMLVGAILDGRLPVGTPLPSSRRLAEELSVARNTVVLAYQQLVDKGYLVSRERSGHYVNPEILGFRLEPVGPAAPAGAHRRRHPRACPGDEGARALCWHQRNRGAGPISVNGLTVG